MSRPKSGFTILEILIVVLIVGILAAVAVYSLNVTRAKNRDTKRVSDMSVLRAAVSQYWLQQATYPQTTGTGVDLGRPGSGADKLTAGGFVASDSNVTPVYLNRIPLGPKSNEFYRYHGSSFGYAIRFFTERDTVYGKAGKWYAHAGGVDQEDSEK